MKENMIERIDRCYDCLMKELITSSASNLSNISDEPTQLTSKDFDIATEIFKNQGLIGEEMEQPTPLNR